MVARVFVEFILCTRQRLPVFHHIALKHGEHDFIGHIIVTEHGFAHFCKLRKIACKNRVVIVPTVRGQFHIIVIHRVNDLPLQRAVVVFRFFAHIGFFIIALIAAFFNIVAGLVSRITVNYGIHIVGTNKIAVFLAFADERVFIGIVAVACLSDGVHIIPRHLFGMIRRIFRFKGKHRNQHKSGKNGKKRGCGIQL